jgi:uncharacterized repeat protein (TIGR01451 family)
MPRTCRPSGAVARAAAFVLPVFAGTLASSLACAPAAAQIRNTATLEFSTPSGARSIASNTVSLDLARRPTSISFREVPDGFTYPGQRCDAATGRYTPSTVTPEDLAKSTPLKTLNVRDPVFMVLAADGENRDPTRVDTAIITVTVGSLVLPIGLQETGPNTGVFAGGFGAANSNPDFKACELPLDTVLSIGVSYAGDDDSDPTSSTVLIDPEGFVFDSSTGEAVDGATVTLIDDNTGLPATSVFGDDGVSAYPNTVISGGSATDASGEVYRFTPGHYRFPFTPPGPYHLQVTPPSRYTAPSVVGADALRKLPSPRPTGYFIIDASYGRQFVLSDPTPLMADIPLDPFPKGAGASPALTLEKTASVRDASPGEFVQYRLQLANRGAGATAGPVRITDVLPRGLHYRPGSVRGAGEPGVSGDGRTLSFEVGRLAPQATGTVTYIASVGAGTPVGEAVNTARADAI